MAKPNESEMTFWDHLDDLRNTLFRIAGFVGLVSLVFFAFMKDIFNHVILAPSRNDFFLYQWFNEISKKIPYFPDFISGTFNVKVININLASQFLVHLTSSLWFALVFSISVRKYIVLSGCSDWILVPFPINLKIFSRISTQQVY